MMSRLLLTTVLTATLASGDASAQATSQPVTSAPAGSSSTSGTSNTSNGTGTRAIDRLSIINLHSARSQKNPIPTGHPLGFKKQ